MTPKRPTRVYSLRFDAPQVLKAVLEGKTESQGQFAELSSHLALGSDHARRFIFHLCELFAVIFTRAGVRINSDMTGITIDVTTDWEAIRGKAMPDLMALLNRDFIVTPDQRILVSQALTYASPSDKVSAIESAFRRFLSAIKENV